MKKLSDELLNKYIDGELGGKSLEEVKEILKTSEEDLKNFHELQAIDKELKEIKEYRVRDNFTSVLMKRIQATAKAKQQDKKFIAFISSIFLALSLGVIGFAFYLLLPDLSISGTANQNVDWFMNYFIKPTMSVSKLINSQGISIIGSVFSLGLLITGYFFFEGQKSNKRRMNKFN